MRKTAMFAAAVWAALALAAWLHPAKSYDDTERRALAQLPEIRWQTVLSGDFQDSFGDYTLDQFPLRQGLRSLKAAFHLGVLRQGDNNGFYIADGSVVKQEYPLDEENVQRNISRLRTLCEDYLGESAIYYAVVPEKGYYLAEPSGHLALDDAALLALLRDGLPAAREIDLTGVLSAEDYYRTDLHWRQERLLPAAQALCEALGVSRPQEGDFRVTALERPFYGVYYGQAAVPMEPDTMYRLDSDLLDNCTVYDYESSKTLGIYDEEKAAGRDMYEMYLSGSKSLLTIENPAASGNRELLLFRDSFASAITPLILEDYSRVTLIDLRYIRLEDLGKFLDFHGQDVLLLYSATVLNSGTLK